MAKPKRKGQACKPATESPQQLRSRTMRAIRGANTTPERALGKAMWRLGLRYRKQRKGLPGRPDFVFLRARVAVFVDGAFWHGRDWHLLKPKLKGNREFWVAKLERNRARDVHVNQALLGAGWAIIRFWDGDVRRDAAACASEVLAAVRQRTARPAHAALRLYEQDATLWLAAEPEGPER